MSMPAGLVLARTTDVLDQDHHPGGLLRAHRVADGVWARLVVLTGSLVFLWEDTPDERIVVGAGTDVVIPPLREHHVEFDGDVTFRIEFHRTPTAAEAGLESTGLEP